MILPARFRFKLERWKAALRSAVGSKGESSGAAHRMCPNCRALIDRKSAVCPFCGAATRSPSRDRGKGGTGGGRVLGVIPIPSTATSVIVAVNVGLYALAWYLTQAAASGLNAPGAVGGNIGGPVLVRLGAKCPLIFAGEWWRLVTAMFLHAGLLHIGMNLWCLIDLGAEVESVFSTPKFIVLYLVTGVAGFLASLLWSPFGVSIGASGAILGLVGILIGWSFHHGHLGKMYRGQLVRWVIYIFVFGLVSGIFGLGLDNAAHLGGLLAGLVLGYVVPEGEAATRSSENLWSMLSVISVLVIAGSVALMALQFNRPLP